MSGGFKVLIADKMSDAALSIFKKHSIDVDVKTSLSEDEIVSISSSYDAIVVRSSTKITKKIIDSSSRLKVLGRAGIGVDNIDVDAASKKGVIVMNTPFGNSTTTAEHTIAMMFAVARKIPQANKSTHEGKWEKTKYTGIELTGKTIGIIGCGNIGSIVASRAVGLKMKVICYDPFLTDLKASEMKVEKVSTDELFARSDVITIHTPLIDSTKNIINKQTLSKTKKGVIIINCARGGLVNEQDLRDAVDSGHVYGAAIDVFTVEPAKESVLFGSENIVCTPHLGASTFEAQENVSLEIAEQISEFLKTGKVENSVNFPSADASELKKAEPYLDITQKISKLLGRIVEGEIKSIEITVSGTACSINKKLVTNNAIFGLLSYHIESINYVSAPFVAKEKGISIAWKELSETSLDSSYKNTISISVTTSLNNFSVKGTVFNENVKRVVDINGVAIESFLEGSMLYINNYDKPGLVGKVGTALGENSINIENFTLSCNKKNNDAMALVRVSSAVPTEVLKKLELMPEIKKLFCISF